jgi:hypothetical protein
MAFSGRERPDGTKLPEAISRRETWNQTVSHLLLIW